MEFLKQSHNSDESLTFLKSENFKEKCKKEQFLIGLRLINKMEIALEKKKSEISSNINNYQKSRKNNFNALKIPLNSTASILNNLNAISSICNTNGTGNNSSININSISLGGTNNNINMNFDNDNFKIEANNKQQNSQIKSIELDSIGENIDNNSESEESQEDFFNFLKFDLKRKIKREDIEWEKEAFDIWNPQFDDEDESIDMTASETSTDVRADDDIVVAVAKDEAFCFLYEENIEAIKRNGATIEYFSPLVDMTLPVKASALYIPGGYPELYLERLSKNKSMLDEIKLAVEIGMPVIAECGGFMYLGKEIDGYSMVGAIDISSDKF